MADAPRPLRCAIYTRKSTEEGLEQNFNTLQAQREAAEAYIQSHKQSGWSALPEHFDDGGFSGAGLDRPALKKLLATVEARTIDCVLVYKVDRLSRSLLDFARLMELFDRCGVSFVSVTQDFNTTTSLGRLTLNILLSFAQFEREIISERTRDKLSAARRKGKWIGGIPVLGYDVHPNGGKLVVNPQEADVVRKIYGVFTECGTLEQTFRVVNERGLRTKAWTTSTGVQHLGGSFNKSNLRLLLSNVIYTGRVSHKGTIYPGEHDPIMDTDTWERVVAKLAENGKQLSGRKHHNRTTALTPLLVCAGCGDRLAQTHTNRKGQRYEYYSCRTARKKRSTACSQPPIATSDLWDAVKENLQRTLGADLSDLVISRSVQKIAFDGSSRRASIFFQNGTSCEVQVPTPVRPGVVQSATAEANPGRVPRVSRLLALAIKLQRAVAGGNVRNYREIAQAGRVSRARMSHIMSLTNLAPSIQEEIVFLPKLLSGKDRITERDLRPIAEMIDWECQLKTFRRLMDTRR